MTTPCPTNFDTSGVCYKIYYPSFKKKILDPITNIVNNYNKTNRQSYPSTVKKQFSSLIYSWVILGSLSIFGVFLTILITLKVRHELSWKLFLSFLLVLIILVGLTQWIIFVQYRSAYLTVGKSIKRLYQPYLESEFQNYMSGCTIYYGIGFNDQFIQSYC